MTDRWFAAQTQAGFARMAREHLRRQDYTVFLPEVRVGRASEIYFPGYIFVLFDQTLDRWRSINGTRGVVKLLPVHMEIPLPLPIGYVEEMQRKLVAGELTAASAEETTLSYMPNDYVPIASGPFAGFSGKMVRYRKGSLELLLSLLGRETVIPVPVHQIVPRARAVHPESVR